MTKHCWYHPKTKPFKQKDQLCDPKRYSESLIEIQPKKDKSEALQQSLIKSSLKYKSELTTDEYNTRRRIGREKHLKFDTEDALKIEEGKVLESKFRKLFDFKDSDFFGGRWIVQ